MRTTLQIEDDVLEVAKQIAQQRGKTLGQAVSELLRQALEPKRAPRQRNGVPLFPLRHGARKPSLTLVNKLRDEA